MTDQAPEVRRAAILSLGRIGKGDAKVVDALKKYAADPDPEIKLDATIALAGNKPDVAYVPLLTSALGNANEGTAKAATKILGNIAADNPDKALPGLVEILNKKDQAATRNTLAVIRRMKSHAMSALPQVGALYETADRVNKLDIIDTLVAIDADGQVALPIVLKELKEKDPQDRREALLNLLRYKPRSDEFIDPLIAELNDPDVEDRLLAIGIVKSLGDKGAKATPKIIQLTEDPDVRVRLLSVSALSVLTPNPEVYAALDKSMKDLDYRVRKAAAKTLGQIGPSDREKVSAMLRAALESERNENAKSEIASQLENLQHKGSRMR
jgi:HEAT repeat protein